jgi:molecular chaperone DnaK (HSP70)
MSITVPGYFTHQERQALLDAVAIANKNFNQRSNVELINEVSAIGLDYGFYKRN